MKAVAAFPESKKLEVVEHPAPQLAAPGDVLLRVLEIGLCGTDKEIASFQYGTPPAGSDHLVIGHESLMEVVEVGPEVKGLAPGQLAVMMVRRPCNRPACPACRMGRQDFCITGAFTERGINGAHGYMTERVVDDQRYVIPLPAELRDIGVLTEPLTIAEKALLEVGDVQDRLPWLRTEGRTDHSRLKAVVLGAGPVGLLGAMALVVRGYDVYVYSLERPPHPKADFVEAIGAHYVCAQDGIEALTRTVGNIDLVYEATGAASVAFKVLEVLGTNGMFILTGVPGRKGPIEVEASLIMRNLVLKNQLVYGTVNAGRDAFEAAVKDLQAFRARWPKQVASLLTGRYTPEEAPKLLTGKPSGIKNTIAFG